MTSAPITPRHPHGTAGAGPCSIPQGTSPMAGAGEPPEGAGRLHRPLGRSCRARSRPVGKVALRAVAVLCRAILASLVFAGATTAQGEWSGEWQTYWRDGLAQITMVQDGSRVTGTYRPDEGVIEGTVSDGVLSGTWREPGGEGGFVFALTGEGDSFTGRFSDGQYWNGERMTPRAGSGARLRRSVTPQDALESVLRAANAAVHQRDTSALREMSGLLLFEGDASDTSDHTRRRWLLWEIVDMSTFRLVDAPVEADAPDGDTASFPISTYYGNAEYTLRFRRDAWAGWRLVVEPLERLQTVNADTLAVLGHETYAEFAQANAQSPRNTLRSFIEGTRTWDDGGREQVMATMDLSYIPPRLRTLEAELITDHLREIINRVGFGIWQEIPNITVRAEPFPFYLHPAGDVMIEPQTIPETDPPEIVWVFSSDTLRNAPAIYRGMQALPASVGAGPVEPLSEFFRLREWLRGIDPGLVARRLGFEMWQWLSMAALTVVALLLSVMASRVVVYGGHRIIRFIGYAKERDYVEPLRRPVAIFVFVGLVTAANSTIALTQAAGFGLASRVLGVAIVVSAAMLALAVTRVVGGLFRETSETTSSYMDEIVTTLLLGLVRVVIVIVAIIAVADVVGLPYEGVLAGLGIGGVALAFAARETVSNLLGGAILLADRPFKRNDLVELDGKLATIETVGLRSTRLRTLDDTLLVVPNSRLSDQPIANWGVRRRRRFVMTVGVTYDTPPDKLQAFRDGLVEVYMTEPASDQDDCYVGVSEFAASAIQFEIVGYFCVRDFGAQVAARHAVMLGIVKLADRLGVSFALPTRTIHVAGSTTPEPDDSRRDVLETRAAQ